MGPQLPILEKGSGGAVRVGGFLARKLLAVLL